ncbi:hypothetical protein [Desulfuromonas acetoxidans]|nr:hypothetical protein [Desulfuromonas acetoxidans]MBF0646060.1 hypothetical protein [Desulfuromonas acetoxidans]NVD25136.1 hypothetical protein [Desulfuromonas acetoxidans]NVE17242.1 hypothetical protein [Desulfuromonas acetoxidans]
MHEIRTDSDRNYLYITLSGVIDAEDAQAINKEVLAALEHLEDGFHVINDMSQADCGYISCLPLFQEVMTALSTHHVGRVIRIVSDSVFQCQVNAASQQFARYTIEEATSVKEAEALLAATVASDPT